jgi:hypothetical protein
MFLNIIQFYRNVYNVFCLAQCQYQRAGTTLYIRIYLFTLSTHSTPFFTSLAFSLLQHDL